MSVGLLVACVVWGVLAPNGRRAAEARPRPMLRRPWAARRRGDPAVGAGSVRLLVTHVGSALRSGAPPGAAWRAAGVQVDQHGVPDRDDLHALVGRRTAGSGRQVDAVLAASRLAADVGAPLGAVLESIAHALAAETEARTAREASLAGPAATARILLWLPLVGVLLGAALGVDPVATALGGGLGTAGLLAGGVLLLVGRRWTGRLVARARAAGAPP
jgi:tight adherence protein B